MCHSWVQAGVLSGEAASAGESILPWGALTVLGLERDLAVNCGSVPAPMGSRQGNKTDNTLVHKSMPSPSRDLIKTRLKALGE